MKGYLQCMAAQAMRPQNGIHPMVGSIYAGSGSAGVGLDANSFGQEKRVLVQPKNVPAQRETAHTGARSTAPAQQPGERAEEGDASLRSETRGAAIPDAGFEPLVKRTQREVAHALSQNDLAEADAQPVVRVRAARAQDPSSLDVTENGRPLLPRTEAPRFATDKTHHPERFVRAKGMDRDSGPIEIHIGRIEVTALPETPRPAAVARSRKSLDLGQYLKRRDGRTG